MKKINKKLILSNILQRLAVYRFIRTVKNDCLLVLNYHRLYKQSLRTKFDVNVFEHSADVFEQHLKFIKNNFTVVSENDVLQMVSSNKINDRCVLVTFDDGYIDNYTVAYPLLTAYDIPAVFFIPTEFINERSLGWWDIVSYIIKKSSRNVISLNKNKFSITTPEEQQQAIDYSLSFIKRTPFEESRFFVHDLARACEVVLPAHELQSSQLMQWKHIVEMSENGIAIGSHTHSHWVLSGLDSGQQMDELRVSKEILEKQLGRPVHSLSYPVGGYSHFSRITQEIAERVGYTLSFSYNTGFNKSFILDRFDIKRFSLSPDIRLMQGELFLPSIFCSL